MIGLLLLYFIGKGYFQLAKDYQKKPTFLYSILGIAFYYLGTIVFGFVLGILAEIFLWEFIYEMNTTLLSLIALPFGLLTTWGAYRLLLNNWKNNKGVSADLIDDHTH